MKEGSSSSSPAAAAILDLSPERLIAVSRLALAALGLFAIWLDPSQPAIHASVAYAILTLYLVYSAALAVCSLFLVPDFGTQVIIHAVDIAAFAGLMHFTEGPTSPFFVFFTFALFTATVRWNWQGALATGLVLALLLVFIGMIAAGPVYEDELNRAIIRASYLAVAASILAYLGVIRERGRERVARLAEWPAERIAESDFPPLHGALAHAMKVIKADRALVLWEITDEPYLYQAFCSGDGCDFRRVPPIDGELAIAGELGDRSFFVLDSRSGLYRTRQTRRLLRGRPLGEGLVAEYAIDRAVVAPVVGERFSGHLLLMDSGRLTEDLLPLAEIVAARISGEIQHHMLRQQLVEATATSERVRFARDMHDGLLQALTAAALQIRVILADAPDPLKPRLADLQRLVADQQQRLRVFVSAVRQRAPAAAEFHLEKEIGQMLAEVAVQWGCATELKVFPAHATVPRPLGSELALMISEAVANAARHGEARNVRVRIRIQEQALHVRIRDDGQGYSAETGAGKWIPEAALPASLRERVAASGGVFKLSSSITGVQIVIEMPLQ